MKYHLLVLLLAAVLVSSAVGAKIIGGPPGSRCSRPYTIGSMRDVAICEFEPRNGKRAAGPMIKKGDDLVFNGTHFIAESHKAIICHRRNGLPPITISVSQQSVPAHLAHGDTEGPCVGGDGCPAACDDVCPSACGNVTGGADGINCWDLNENGVCDLETEDINMDGDCNVTDCAGADGQDGQDGVDGQDGQDGQDGVDGQDGADGFSCWDLNQNGMCDLGTEDINGDNMCTTADCAGAPCWDLNGNLVCDLPGEDMNGDNMCTVADCQGADGMQGPPGAPGNCTCPPVPQFVKMCCYIAIQGSFPPGAFGAYPILGQQIWLAHQTCGGGNTPTGFAQCNGQLLSIAQNPALFSLLGIKYGGDGLVTFALPDLQNMKGIINMM